MTTVVEEKLQVMPSVGRASPVPAAVGVALCLLMAVIQVAFAGYQIGGGNQPIQIAFLQHAIDPALFAKDEMVRQTLPLYATYFFQMIAPLAKLSGIGPLYVMLQLLTSFFTLCAVYLLGRSIFRSHAAALVAAALLVAGHQRALAGEWLYTPWFTHTLAALPIAILALALAYRRRMIFAFAVCGILFNIHALTGAYVLAMLVLALLADAPEMPRKQWWLATFWSATAVIVLALPTLLQMLRAHQVFDAAWLHLMHVRSADHSFPSTWWADGNGDLPRFVLIFALFVLSWSFSPVRRKDTARALRVTVWMTIAVGLLFLAGYLFTDIWPVPLVIRLQPFRASRLLLVLMLVHIAYGAAEGIRAGFKGRATLKDGGATELGWAARIGEIIAGVLALATLGIPALLVLLPVTVVVVMAAALISGRLSKLQSVIGVASLVVTVLAFRQIQFAVPFLSPHISLLPGQWTHSDIVWIALTAAIAGAIFAAILRKPLGRAVVIGAMLLVGSGCCWALFARDVRAGENSPLAAVGDWAQSHTAKDAIFLAPNGSGAFRIYGRRGIVADWRDGTQLYFSSTFGPEWWERLSAIEPGILLSSDGQRMVSRGRPLDTLDDKELIKLAWRFKADYILLPTPPKKDPRSLVPVYADAHYTAYLPKILPSEAKIPAGVINPAEWTAMEHFMDTTVKQNIEKYRKTDVAIQIVDKNGLPVQDLPAMLNETDPAFLFGCSLSFFETNNLSSLGDQKAPPVSPTELKLFPTLFNATMIPFSGKWMYLQPQDGPVNYSDLDKYMDYCQKNHIAVEYHFLSGLLPEFLRKNPKLAAERFPQHAMDLVDRYHDKVAYWQVYNDHILMRDAPAVIKALRAKYPGIKLGISDCARFYSDQRNPVNHEEQMYRGFDGIGYLKSQGALPDFFSMHGHYPVGLWADPRTMYQVFDKFQNAGVRVHVSEFFLPLGSRIAGPVRTGKWTPELQAEYFTRFLTVCFSHPDVDMVNIWGMPPRGWGGSAGILDDKLNPRLAFYALKKLFRQTWHTRIEEPLPLDGVIRGRVFQGTYHLTLKLADGREVQTDLTVPEKPTASLKFRLDAATRSLTEIK